MTTIMLLYVLFEQIHHIRKQTLYIFTYLVVYLCSQFSPIHGWTTTTTYTVCLF